MREQFVPTDPPSVRNDFFVTYLITTFPERRHETRNMCPAIPKESQPPFLSPKRVLGISQPHHVRLLRSRTGAIVLQYKPWVTSERWSAPVELVPASRAAELRHLWPDLVEPAWDSSFLKSSLNWLQKDQRSPGANGHAHRGAIAL